MVLFARAQVWVSIVQSGVDSPPRKLEEHEQAFYVLSVEGIPVNFQAKEMKGTDLHEFLSSLDYECC